MDVAEIWRLKGAVLQWPTAKDALNRSAGYIRRRSSWRRIRGHLLEGGRSLMAFTCGLLLASLYGITALFVQKQPLWLCAYATVGVALLAAFGMGLWSGVRADVLVLLPTLCSAHGRKFLLFLFASALLTGPVTNTLENTERAAASLLCGAELAANQTRELMQRAATPLSSALDRIRELSRNAVSAAGRVRSFMDTLMDSTRHIARTLRNVLHFLVDIGDVCNTKLGSPYRKCRLLFTQARADCSELLGDFNFLCDIVDGFMPLCSLARAGEIFCVVPSFIADHLRKRLAAPAVAAFERMKREFDFDLAASVTFDLAADSSHSLPRVYRDIMEDLSAELHVVQKLGQPLAYAGLVMLAFAFLRAVRYRRRYLHEIDFDNIYITAQFSELDQQETSGGGASVLPITQREAETYISPLSWHLTAQERRAVMMGVASVLRHLLTGGLVVALDFLVFWMLDQGRHLVKRDIVARAPVTVAVQVNGSGYASDIFRDLVAAFNVLQGGNITVISKKCLLEPSQPDYAACFLLGFLLGLALLVAVSGGFMQRCRRLACASLHPEREQERIRFLRQQILDQRRAERRALRRSTARGRGGGGAAGWSGVQSLLLRLPGAAHLAHLSALSSVDCRSCGAGLRQAATWDVLLRADITGVCQVEPAIMVPMETSRFHNVDGLWNPVLKGVHCRACFHRVRDACSVCVRPLTLQEVGEAQLDSSDEEQLSRTITMASHPNVGSLTADVSSSDTSNYISIQSDLELSEADSTNPDGAESDSSNDPFCRVTSAATCSLQDQDLQAVTICPRATPHPKTSRNLQGLLE